MQRVIISGASGLIGGALATSLLADGAQVIRLVRRPPRAVGPREVEVCWDPTGARLDPDALAGATAVVNLSGASIGRLPWTRRYRQTLERSRILSTRTLATAIGELGDDAPPFVSASAVGFYGHRPGEHLTEQSVGGETFLARLCAKWEQEARKANSVTRVALLRTAPLLHPAGVLRPMITLARRGLSGPLGSGRQVWPWISLTDEVRAIRHIIDHDVHGPVNLAGPTPATANEIGRALAHRLRRPYLLPAPAWALRLGIGGDAADSLLLADAHVQPDVLTRSGFTFTHPTAQDAIDDAVRA